MMIPYVLKIWAFFVLLAVASGDTCPEKRGCIPGQIGTPHYVTRLLQCDYPNCESATFAASYNLICLIRPEPQKTRIYLRNCSDYSSNEGYFITDTASVLPSSEGSNSKHTLFTYTGCNVFCGDNELTKYKASSNGQLLTEDRNEVATSSIDDCTQGLYFFPKVTIPGECGRVGGVGPSGPPDQKGNFSATSKRQCPSQTRRRVMLTITDGESVLAVGAPEIRNLESYRLPIVAEINGEVFYAQEYGSLAVGASGTVENVTAYTLQLARSKKYLVADVLDDTTLNYVGHYSTGLNLENAAEFPGGYAREPDYRFFVQYNVIVHNQTATVFCPLFHRNHCICPGVSGYLRLTPVKYSDRSLQPTFINPTDDVLRNFVLYSQSTESGKWWQVQLSIL